MSSEGHVICASPNPWRRRRLRAILGEAGFEVQTCATPDEVLDLLAHLPRPADESSRILLLDLELSEQVAASGIIAALRGDGLPVRTIVLAETGRSSEIIGCLRAGADDFVHLPAAPAEIVESVCRVHALPHLI